MKDATAQAAMPNAIGLGVPLAKSPASAMIADPMIIWSEPIRAEAVPAMAP